jgi:hypothetical protein
MNFVVIHDDFREDDVSLSALGRALLNPRCRECLCTHIPPRRRSVGVQMEEWHKRGLGITWPAFSHIRCGPLKYQPGHGNDCEIKVLSF